MKIVDLVRKDRLFLFAQKALIFGTYIFFARLKPTGAFISHIAEAAGREEQKSQILFPLSQILQHHHHLAAEATKKPQLHHR